MYTPVNKKMNPFSCWLPALILGALGLVAAYTIDLIVLMIALISAIICGAQAFALSYSGSNKMAISGSGVLLLFITFLAASTSEGLHMLLTACSIITPGISAIWIALYRANHSLLKAEKKNSR